MITRNRTVVTFKNILSTKTNWLHLIIFFILATSLATVLYILIIPITFWGIYGEGASADRIGSLPITIFIGEWMPLIIVLAITGFNLSKKIFHKDLAGAKSHLLVAVLVTICYLFSVFILGFSFEIFQ